MSFTAPFNVHHRLWTRDFDVTKDVTVDCLGYWDRPANCHYPSYVVELFSVTLLPAEDPITGRHFKEGISVGKKVYPANGTRHTETWSGLHPGHYALQIEASEDPHCVLVGTIDVKT